MTQEDYVSYKTAQLLKEKGFIANIHEMYDHDGKFCEATFTNVEPYYSCYAPTLQMVRKWLREKHHLHIEVRITNHSISSMVNVIKYYWVMCDTETGRWCDESTVYTVRTFDKSEEAEEDAIRHALEKI